MEDRSVVVDSLLCFVKNFRYEPNLQSLVVEHFPTAAQSYSINLLLDILANSDDPSLSTHSSSTEEYKSSSMFKQIIGLFDKVASSKRAPIFVAENLTCLPMVLVGTAAATANKTRPLNQIGGGCGGKTDNSPQKDPSAFPDLRQMHYFLQEASHPTKEPSSIEGSPQKDYKSQQQTRDSNKAVHAKSPESTQSSHSSTVSLNTSTSFSSLNFITSREEALEQKPTTATFVQSQPTAFPIKEEFAIVRKNPGKKSLAQVVSKLTNRQEREDLVQSQIKHEKTHELECTNEEKDPNTGQKIHEKPRLPSAMKNFPLMMATNPSFFGVHPHSNNNNNSSAAPFINLFGGLMAAGVGQPPLVASTSTSPSLFDPVAKWPECFQMAARMLTKEPSLMATNNNVGSHLSTFGTVTDKSIVMGANKQPGKVEGMELEDEDDDEDMQLDSSGFHSGNDSADHQENTVDKDAFLLYDDKCRSSRDTSSSPSEISVVGEDNNGKPYYCTVPGCNKRFKKHEFIHTGLKPHVCPFCSKGFNRKDNLLRHHKTHLANALNEGGRRRHNMLYGVTEEMAAGLFLPPSTGTSSTRKSGKISKAKERKTSMKKERV